MNDSEIIIQLLNDAPLEPQELDRAKELLKELDFLVRKKGWQHQQDCLAEMKKAKNELEAFRNWKKTVCP